jgi:hypothetical protein
VKEVIITVVGVLALIALAYFFIVSPMFKPKQEGLAKNTTCEMIDKFDGTLAAGQTVTCPLVLNSRNVSYCIFVDSQNKRTQIMAGVERANLTVGNYALEFYECK